MNPTPAVRPPVVRCVVEARDTLGEVPLWDARVPCLYWIDVRGPKLQAYFPDSGQTRSWPMPQVIGSIALRASGGLLLALKSGLHGFDPVSGALEPLLDPEPAWPDNRLNDGKCDRQGRFWVGSMNDGDRRPTGTLYRIGEGLRCDPMFDGITVPNSLAWSPDGRTMYFSDTPTLRILAWDFDPASGDLGKQRLFADLSAHPGRADGSTVDVDGCLWNAEVWGARLVRYTPAGKVDRVIDLPVSGVTCCAFGGSDMCTLFVTTCRQKMSEAQLAAEPLAGGLFALDVGVAGIPETPFKD